MRNVPNFVAGLFFALLSVGTAPAQSSDALAALRTASLFGDSRYLTIKMTMSIVEGGGAKERALSIKSSRVDGSDKTLAAVVSPAFLNKLAFLRVKDGEGTRQWLRTSNGVKRIAEGNRNERLFGSDFTASDFLDAASDARSAEYGQGRGEGLVVVRADTADGDRVVSFGSADRLVRSVEYLGKDGRVLKRYRVVELETRDGKPYPKKAIMENLLSGGSTTVVIDSIDDETMVSDRVFNPASL
ncbi:MAG: hypothetical protein A2Z99_07720 [Treponema sp. GWB1_62_6]|nr:MAG: hypothetical protein A2Z99_07720 [Treponema sp. GWB1_62_6]OHE68604.1 MAG: hypothetical protein A2001_05725 [Treponema sp. GWC1_61_84]OHE70410.1 MAG: hypothetical protein A2413_15425 [Treponema sp. RIFOXYC1_FULL_61_9]